MGDGGKGDSPRPFAVDTQTFSNNWDLVFKKKTDDEVKTTTNEKSPLWVAGAVYRKEENA